MSQENKRQELIEALSEFTARDKGALFNATASLLDKLGIQFDRDSAQPIQVAELYDGPMPQYLINALDSIEETFFIGIVNDQSLLGGKTDEDLEAITKMMQRGDKYDGMFIFACDAKHDANLTRTAAAALTRAFNHIACANPVILLIRQDDLISLSTCERMEYSQQWRQATGQKVGKVCILRNIKCSKTHPGHLDILVSLGDKQYPTFEELYKHWMEVFSSELLTKKFYSELSDWYAWAVQVARFPNDLNTREDDDKFNHEACIRLITRLIFVWFLKQKKLIPEEFFDEKYIRENLITEFNPHERRTAFYDAEKSRYYRLVLQNLFFAMLNCPIVAEGKDVANNRRFRAPITGHRLNRDYNVNNLMRYESEFMEGGADKFVALANRSVPFLNGGLFDCLDDKPKGLFYDGFSEQEDSLDQLYMPDYLFFGDEVGKGIDLSQWYGDRNKRNVSARGIIDILKRYSFTVEESTPLDQEVSLDPELLGKAFENLLAAFNPETKMSARKQTGSFYTPRDIVQYMVDESLVAHLKRTCGDDLEFEYRRLLSYATEETNLDKQQRKTVMAALYNCRVLDPACGSGAFPMGVLQQMVHVLRQLDPTNEMWREFMIDLAIERSKTAFNTVDEDERRERLADIEEAFNRNINDPDYARKLYLIEHCIYGVDIQPIAVQISKLRFFISLVVDQKPTSDAAHNFGIRPLPNLESKFVAANTLIPVEYDGSLVEGNKEVRKYKERLRELNHKIFLAKRNVDKQRLKNEINTTRQSLANAIEETGFVGHSEAKLLASWDMFDQNASSPYFDPEWMFGVKGEFDIVIGNPPWGADLTKAEKECLKSQYPEIDSSTPNSFAYFVGCSYRLFGNVISFVLPDSILIKDYAKTRELICHQTDEIVWYQNSGVPYDLKPFKYVDHDVCVIKIQKDVTSKILLATNYYKDGQILNERNLFNKSDVIKREFEYSFNLKVTVNDLQILKKLSTFPTMSTFMQCHEGIHSGNIRGKLFIKEYRDGLKPLFYGGGAGDIINVYYSLKSGWYVDYRKDIIDKRNGEYASLRDENIFKYPKIYITRTGNPFKGFYDEDSYASNNFFSLQMIDMRGNTKSNLLYVLPFINSKVCQYFIRTFAAPRLGNCFVETKIFHLLKFPIPTAPPSKREAIINLVNEIIESKKRDISCDTSLTENILNILVYYLYGFNYDEVLIIDPETPITRDEYDNYKAE